ncbi:MULTISPECIES: histidine kinase N-terminal 7TM domain-containing protein [Haloarcula]|uniref:histidine kinase N-terminal 7TM domain-containing protein n=1 Tax=Haloarcula TaxID=2237 RepID=UPI0023E87332|nr:histidine kinase N-terminal 7TM domain-containing protein [Halomicroarcula sp. SHR3]
MVFQVTPLLGVNILIFCLLVSLLTYAVYRYLRHDRSPVLFAFVGYLSTLSLMELSVIFVKLTTVPELLKLGYNFSNAISIPLGIYSGLWFILVYTENEGWVNRWFVALAAVHVGGLTAVLTLAPEFMYDFVGLATRGPVSVLGITFEQWVILERDLKLPFLIHQLSIYASALLGAAILFRYLIRHRTDLQAGQTGALIVGMVTPAAVNTLLFLGIVPPSWTLSDFGFLVTSVAFAIAIFRYRLFRVVPVGRQRLMEALEDPVVMLDEDRRVVDTNEAVRGLVGISRGWRLMPVAEFFAAVPIVQNRLGDGLDGETVTIPATDDAHDGDTVPEPVPASGPQHFEVQVSPIRSPTADREGELLIFRDVTGQVEYSRQLEQQNERLERFASVVSHDLRNPLMVAQSRLALVRQRLSSEHFEPIARNLDRMGDIVEDILTIARAGGAVEPTDPVALAELARAAWGHTAMGESTLELDDLEETTVLADGDQLLHVFENLYRNAADHNDRPVTVRVGTFETDGRGTIGLFVEDDGAGVPAEADADLFEHGYTTREDGTGFGLSIVAEVVESHGWSVRATDSATGGFRIEITGIDPAR